MRKHSNQLNLFSITIKKGADAPVIRYETGRFRSELIFLLGII